MKIPVSLYIHIPWCIHKCPYCDFNSYAVDKQIPENDYVKALILDLKNDLNSIPKGKLHNIFIGGGTPSLLSPNIFAELLDKIRTLLPFKNNIEITLEANPGTISQSKLQILHKIGINRLSIGIQSFHNDKLKAVGRIHDRKDAIKAIAMAKAAGFNNINIDLMYGLPNQTIEDAIDDIKTAISLAPTHISWYQLTIEPNTIFYKKPPDLPDEDLIWEIQRQGQQIITNSGFKQYEISAYSKPGFQCQHNLNYWQFGDYLGIGAGAHSKITNTRISKSKHPQIYMNKFITEEKVISPEDLILEFMLNTLRLNKPIPIKLFTERTSFTIDAITNSLNQAQKQGFLKWNSKAITTTAKGKRFLNQLLLLFVEDKT